jgi:hypothetical protein
MLSTVARFSYDSLRKLAAAHGHPTPVPDPQPRHNDTPPVDTHWAPTKKAEHPHFFDKTLIARDC